MKYKVGDKFTPTKAALKTFTDLDKDSLCIISKIENDGIYLNHKNYTHKWCIKEDFNKYFITNEDFNKYFIPFKEKDIIEYQGKTYDICKIIDSFYEIKDSDVKDSDKVFILKEHKEEILDNAEKKYLKNVIKPFRNRIIGIEKKECYMSDLDVESEIIFIIDKNQGHSLLPFRKNSMYVGMKLNESYTLEQLGL